MVHGITSLKVLHPNRGNTAKAKDGSATFAEDLWRRRKKIKSSLPTFSLSLLSLSSTLWMHTLAVAGHREGNQSGR